MILTEMKQDLYYVLCYTRLPINEDIYSPKLAYSMHLAYSEDGVHFNELNHNSGVLFAKSTDNPDGTLNAKSLKNPYIFTMADGSFGVVAVRTEADGLEEMHSKGSVLFFITEDFLQYKEMGLIPLKDDTYVNEVKCRYDVSQKKYIIHWSDTEGKYYQNVVTDIKQFTKISKAEQAEPFILDKTITDIEGIVLGNVIQIPKKVAYRLINRLTVPQNIKIEVPSKIEVSSEDSLKKVKAVAVYSDGTRAEKRIDWDTSMIDWNKTGVYTVCGNIHQEHYAFPVAINRADPCIGKWKGKYYFIATNDADNNHTLNIREADNIPDLVDAKEVKILDTTMYEHLGNLLWAPEFHIIGDDLYIFHAGTPGAFEKEQSHVMKLKTGGNPVIATDWIMPERVMKKDGSYLYGEAGITLDMTCFEQNGSIYVIWAQRQFFPVDQGSWLYIAKVDARKPWMLITDPVLLSRPEYGWENNHTFVEEGPFALITDKKIFVTFSGAMVDTTYTVGLLSADKDADLLDPANWMKENYPILTSRSVIGEYGPGHNAFVMDEDGTYWNTYHARAGANQPRSAGIRRVHFDIDGYPVLDLIEEKDLDISLAKVSATVIVNNATAIRQNYKAAVCEEQKGTLTEVSYSVRNYINQSRQLVTNQSISEEEAGRKTVLGEEIIKKCAVYLPAGYDEADKSTKYNVLYLLHGVGGNRYEWSAGNEKHDGYNVICNLFDNLIKNGDIEPLIVIFTEGRSAYDWEDTSFNIDGTNMLGFYYFDYELRYDLIPFIEAKFNTYANIADNTEADISYNRLHRAIGGLSMGGMQSLNLGLGGYRCDSAAYTNREPKWSNGLDTTVEVVGMVDLFAFVGAFSNAPTSSDGDHLGSSIAANGHKLELLYITCGDADGIAYQDGFSKAVKGLANAAGNKIGDSYSVLIKGGVHDHNVWYNGAYNFSRLCFRASYGLMRTYEISI